MPSLASFTGSPFYLCDVMFGGNKERLNNVFGGNKKSDDNYQNKKGSLICKVLAGYNSGKTVKMSVGRASYVSNNAHEIDKVNKEQSVAREAFGLFKIKDASSL